MTRPTIIGGPFPYLSVGALGGDVTLPDGTPPDPDCCDPATDADMPDRAAEDNGGYMVSLSSGTSGDQFVGSVGGPDIIGGSTPSIWFDGDDLTAGTCNGFAISDPWDVGSLVSVDEIRIRWSYGTFGGGAAAAFAIDGGDTASGPWTEVLADADPVTTAGASYPGDFEHTYVLGASAVYQHWRFRSTGAGNNDIYTVGGIGVTDPLWIVPEPLVIDGDDATYEEITNTDLLRADLGAAFNIVRTRIRIGSNTSGARVLTIKGANLPDFSDEVTLATIAYTATGTYTAQDLTALWTTTESYRYFELSTSVSDTYRVHAWELYEETPGSIVVDDPTTGAGGELQDVLDNLDAALDAHLADTTDVHDHGSLSGLTDFDHPQYVRTTHGGLEDVQTHGTMGAAETIDLADGNYHSGTLDANVTLTLTGATASKACSVLLELTQDGTGGWTLTLPASVANKTELEAAYDTTADTVSFLTLITRDGGTTWYGFLAGSGGAGATALDDLTDVNAPTPSDGQVLTYDSTPGEWVAATPTAVGDLDDLTDVVITTPASTEVLRYDGTNWINDDRIWRPLMDGLGNVITDGGTGEAVMALS